MYLFFELFFIATSLGLRLLASSEEMVATSKNKSISSSWIDISHHDTEYVKLYPTRRLYIQRANYLDSNHIHSCYNMKVKEVMNSATYISRSFCYPAIIITGVPKCSTSALYSLLELFPNSIKLKVKENCPFKIYPTLVEYFQSLPQRITREEVLVDGCIQLDINMQMREILHRPHTFYLVSDVSV